MSLGTGVSFTRVVAFLPAGADGLPVVSESLRVAAVRDLLSNARGRWSGKPEQTVRGELFEPLWKLLGFKAKVAKVANKDHLTPDYELHGPDDKPLFAHVPSGRRDEVVLWREQPAPEVAADIGAEFRRLAEQYHVLEQLCADRRPVRLAESDGATPVSGFGKAEALARQVHAQLQLGDRPGQALLRVLEEVSGLKIFHMDFQPTGTAACTVGETFGPAILLNAGSARWRRNFDLAHELYHILTWRHFRSTTEEDGRVATPDEEKWANKFASVLLMPEGALRSAVGKVIRDGQLQFADLANIAREFDVSADALVWRMVQLSYFTADAARELLARYKSNAEQWESQRERDNPPTLPERYRALAFRSLREGQLSIGRFAEYLGISRSRAMRIAEGEVPDDEPIAVSDS